MRQTLKAPLPKRKQLLLWGAISYVLLLLMSYGFPVTGDDWCFAPPYGSTYDIGKLFARAYDIAAGHYETTNGRLLGNFFVAFFSGSKLLRELVRCGYILGILLCSYRLSDNRGLTSYLIGFALLIAMPAAIVSQTYTWAAGFFNYVAPTMLVLLYFSFVKKIFCDHLRCSTFASVIGLFLLGLLTQFFIENISIGMCVLSAVLLLADWIRSRRPNPALAAHLIGAVVGCTVMLLAPGYSNIGVEGYREMPSDLDSYVRVIEKNFQTLSFHLTRNNLLLIGALCLCGIGVCVRALLEKPEANRLPAKVCMLCFAGFPLICYGISIFGRYYFLIDFLVNLAFFGAVILTAIYCVQDQKARFVLLLSTGCFLVFIAPLLIVTPIGARNAYFFNVLLLLITLTLFRQAVRDVALLRCAAPTMCLAACLLLCGNLWIFFRNGSTEQLRNQILTEAMERKEHEITLPGYPYPTYVHAASASMALSYCYHYEYIGDISFRFVTYKQWIETH